MPVSRFGVSLEEETLKTLDQYVKDNNFPSRSQAIRKLIEKNLVEDRWQHNKEVAGAIVLVYDHHKRELADKLTSIQHDYFECILSNVHFHLNHHDCLEIIAVKGSAKKIKTISDKLIALKGVKHGDFLAAY
jgi:CopG family transcriptional regulator, nickel-responsive regulator